MTSLGKAGIMKVERCQCFLSAALCITTPSGQTINLLYLYNHSVMNFLWTDQLHVL